MSCACDVSPDRLCVSTPRCIATGNRRQHFEPTHFCDRFGCATLHSAHRGTPPSSSLSCSVATGNDRRPSLLHRSTRNPSHPIPSHHIVVAVELSRVDQRHTNGERTHIVPLHEVDCTALHCAAAVVWTVDPSRSAPPPRSQSSRVTHLARSRVRVVVCDGCRDMMCT
jgi:hypothetical protein